MHRDSGSGNVFVATSCSMTTIERVKCRNRNVELRHAAI
jgi:hypothetical protein